MMMMKTMMMKVMMISIKMMPIYEYGNSNSWKFEHHGNTCTGDCGTMKLLEVLGPSRSLLAGDLLGLSTSSFASFGRSGRVTHATVT